MFKKYQSYKDIKKMNTKKPADAGIEKVRKKRVTF